jgi:hypothetical protein
VQGKVPKIILDVEVGVRPKRQHESHHRQVTETTSQALGSGAFARQTSAATPPVCNNERFLGHATGTGTHARRQPVHRRGARPASEVEALALRLSPAADPVPTSARLAVRQLHPCVQHVQWGGRVVDAATWTVTNPCTSATRVAGLGTVLQHNERHVPTSRGGCGAPMRPLQGRIVP